MWQLKMWHQEFLLLLEEVISMEDILCCSLEVLASGSSVKE